MEKINKIKVKGIDHEITLTEEEAKNVVDKQLVTKTAVPNSGYVDKVYFNTKLSAEEVDSYLSKLTYVDFDGMLVNVLFTNATGTNILLVFNDGVKYEIFHATSIDGSGYTQIYYTDKGWLLDKFEINDTGASELMGLSIGSQNDLIKDLVYVQSEKYATVEKVESYLYTSEEPNAVPNTGTIEKLYFNTNLSEEEVTNYINDANLNFIKIGDRTVYLFAIDTEALNGIGIFKLGENKYAINQANFTTLSTENILFHTSELTNSQNVQGWESELKNNNGLYKATFNTVSSYQNMPIGQQNDLLVNLISLTPFGKQEKYVSKDYLDEYMKNNFENGNEGSY